MQVSELLNILDAGIPEINGIPLIYPAAADGMPPPGPDMVRMATALFPDDPMQHALTKLYALCLYSTRPVVLSVLHKGSGIAVPLLRGHKWGSAGPAAPADVMIIGKMPGRDEMRACRNFVGASGRLLAKLLRECGFSANEIESFFVTNVLRWFCELSTVPQAWINDCLPLLHQELRLVRPRVIILMGDEAVRALYGRRHKARLTGAKELTLDIPVHTPGSAPVVHTARVFIGPNPALVCRRPEREPVLRGCLEQFASYMRNGTITYKNARVVFETITTASELDAAVSEICAVPGIKKIAIDLEWEGAFPTEPGAYVRTVQISHKPYFAYVIKLRDASGESSFTPNIRAAVSRLNELFTRDDIQLGGAHIAADIPWLESLGVFVFHLLRVPGTANEMRGGEYSGLFDVALAEHACNETGPFDLESLAVLRCGYASWSDKLTKWKSERARELGIAEADLPGYGSCPDDILIPYAAMDAAATRELIDVYCDLLNHDRFGNDCWRAFHNAMRALPAFIEMHRAGIGISKARIEELTESYATAYAQCLSRLREEINWPSFNPRSYIQTAELLFGEQATGKRDLKTGEPVRVRPEGAMCLYLTPVKQTGNAKQRIGEQRQAPSTDKETCGILAAQHPVAGMLRDVRFIDHILKTVLRPPVFDDEGESEYTGGIASFIRADGRVHSFFRQLVETGRVSSSRPPLQNLAKRREAAYARIMGDRYPGPLRSIVQAARGYKLVEADFVLAELVCASVVAREHLLLEHCRRAALPEADPDHYDLHSQMAVRAFGLQCKPTKHGLAEVGALPLRVAAKNIIFGAIYGRTAEAVARQCREEGNEVSVDDAQRLIDTLFATYPNLYNLQEALRSRVTNEGWIMTCWGRLRRFYRSDDPATIAAQQREALNFPAQSMVADAMNAALHNLYTFPDRHKLGYRIVLQQHDACILEVPERAVGVVAKEVLPLCMRNSVTFSACNLDGIPYKDGGTYNMDIDVSVFTYWGIPEGDLDGGKNV